MQTDQAVTKATLQSHIEANTAQVEEFNTELRATRTELSGKLDVISNRQFDLIKQRSPEVAQSTDEEN